MKFKINKIGLFCLLLMMMGCDDFLNIKDESAISSDIWDSESSAQLYVNNIYKMCAPSFGGDYVYGEVRATACSDESANLPDLIIGTLGSSKVGGFSADTYAAIRFINIALKELEESTMQQDAFNRISGQLYFFRAWQHWKMILLHGGVPYMKGIVDYVSEDELLNAKRNKTSECITYLKEDLGKAIKMLPSKWTSDTDWGRVTNATAAAFLGRILLFYASPQFTPDQQSSVARDRWQEAYNANKEAVTICKAGGYGLLDCTTTITTEWPAPADINNIFLKSGPANTEALFVRVYDAADNSHSYENSVRPGAQTNSSTAPSNLPTLRLMKAFPNADGTPYEKDNTDLEYWKDRDSRFYSTIVYNGCYFPYAANSTYRQWIYKSGDPSKTMSTTGFYCRKMLNPATVNFAKTSTNWIELRYAEVLLNLAESALEVGDEDTMYDCLGQIRKRAGIPEGAFYYGLKANSNMSNLELVMNERLIELAFEGKRFHDLRRRNMFTEDLGPTFKALNGEKKMSWALSFSLKKSGNAALNAFAKVRDTYTMDEVTDNMKVAQVTATAMAYELKYLCVPDEESLRATQSGNYNFFDVLDGIITRSPAIQQTMGWSYDADRGCFNPFE